MNDMEQKIIRDIEQMKKDLALIKEILLAKNTLVDDEGELSDWAKEELERARNTSESEYVSFDEIKKRIKDKK